MKPSSNVELKKVDLEEEAEDISNEQVGETSPQPRKKFKNNRNKVSKKVKSKKLNIAFRSREQSTFMLESFKLMKALINCFESIMNGSPGIVWEILLALSLLALKSQATPMEMDHQTSITEILSSNSSDRL